MKNCLIIDNYDSFTDNLLYLFRKVNDNINYEVLRNDDEKTLSTKFDILVISPGPMRPENSGLLQEIFDKKVIPQKIPVFGVCLGMQFINLYFDGKVVQAKNAIHGGAVKIKIKNHNKLFKNIQNNFLGARYNSLEVKKAENINILATDNESSNSKMIMAIEHNSLPIVGVQFHPESFLSKFGEEIIENFFKYYAKI